jgi:hypothetical protein
LLTVNSLVVIEYDPLTEPEPPAPVPERASGDWFELFFSVLITPPECIR